MNLMTGFILISTSFVLLTMTALNNVGSGRSRRGRGASLAAVCAGLGLGLFCYFTDGQLPGGDAYTHMAKSWFFLRALKAGESPFWVNQWYMGYPAGLYYGFLYNWTSGVFSLAAPVSFFMSGKIFLWLLHVFSGFFMFLLGRRLFESEFAATVVAVIYSFSSLHLNVVLDDGALPLSITFVLLPLIIMQFESFRVGETCLLWASLVTALLISAGILTHVQYGIFSAILLTLWVPSSFFFGSLRNGEVGRTVKPLKYMLFTGLFSILLTGWFLVPFLTDKNWLILSRESPLNYLLGGGRLSLGEVLEKGWLLLFPRVLSNPGTQHALYRHGLHYVGVVPFLLCGAGISRICSKKDHGADGLLGPLILGLPLLLLNSRFTVFWFFALCIAAGYGILEVLERVHRGLGLKKLVVTILILLIVFLDLGPGLFKTPYNRLFRLEAKARYEAVEESWSWNRDLSLSSSAVTLGTVVVESEGNSYIGGGVPQCATRAYAYAAAIIMKAAEEKYDFGKELSSAVKNGLRTLGIGVVNYSDGLGQSLNGSGPAIFSKRTQWAGPVSSSLESETWSSLYYGFNARSLDSVYPMEVVESMGFDPGRPVADVIVLRRAVAEKTPGESGKVTFEILCQEIRQSRMRLEYRSSHEGYIRLAYSYFPYNRALVDGIKAPLLESVMGCSVVRVPSGKHVIEIRPAFSAIRKMLMIPAVLVLVLAVPAAVIIGRRKSC